MLDELSKHGLIHQVAHLIDLNSRTTLSHFVHTGLIGLLVKLASGSMVAVRTLFDLTISSSLKYILSTYGLSYIFKMERRSLPTMSNHPPSLASSELKMSTTCLELQILLGVEMPLYTVILVPLMLRTGATLFCSFN